MVCRECGSKMRLDDRDGFSSRNCENYWVCDSCITSCYEMIRGGVSVKESWYSENEYLSLDDILDLGVALLDNGDITNSHE